MAAALESVLREVDDLISRLKAEPAVPGPSPSNPPLANATSRPGPVGEAAKVAAAAPAGVASQKPAKAKKVKAKPQAAETTATNGGSALAETFSKAKLAVGRVLEVEELENSDKLYRCKVKVGPSEERQIIAGLRKHIAADELRGRLVTVILNLKTAKLAGEASEGMILAAVQKGDQYQHGELVKPISPPGNSEAGDAVVLEGSQPLESYAKEFKHWKKMLPHLAVLAGQATFEGKRLQTSSGPISVDPAVPDGAAIS